MNEYEKRDRFGEFIADVVGEVNRAIVKFPEPDASMCALTEEVGELAKALMDEPRDRVWKEAVQVAAMAARVAVEGDPTLDPTRAKRNADGVQRLPWSVPKEKIHGCRFGQFLYNAIATGLSAGGLSIADSNTVAHYLFNAPNEDLQKKINDFLAATRQGTSRWL